MYHRFHLAFTALLLLALAGVARAQTSSVPPQPGHLQVPYYGQFYELPVGSVQPRGWIQKWLERQAQGLTGHPENLCYPYDTCMFAGLIPPPQAKNKWWKEWWPYEQSAYFIDATTRLSWLIDAPDITRRRDANLDFILAHSSATNLGGSRAPWPNAVVGRALMAQFSATANPRVAAVLQDWLLGSADEIAKGGRGGANFEEAFYLYGLTGDRRLLALCRQVYDSYLGATNSFCTAKRIRSRAPFREHGVTAAELLKCLPLMYAYTGDPEALRLAKLAYQKVLDNNLMADGGIVSSEHLEPAAFYSVHESCDITDWSWSFGYLFMATGEARFADLIERATFNALPGALTKDFKQLQYFSAVNQTVIGATNGHTPRWPARMTYRAAHDTECCSGNINRAMPNYLVRSWMRSSAGGLAAVYYAPSEVKADVAGKTIVITEETDYPFRDTISFRIKASSPVTFSLQLRIPEWCADATLQVNEQSLPDRYPPGAFAAIHREFRDGDVLRLKLPMPVALEDWFDRKSVCVTRGPLVYSLQIAEKRLDHTADPDAIKPFLEGRDIRGFPEAEFLPQSDWRYGVAPALKDHLPQIKVVESAMTDNPFLQDQTPVHLEAPLYHLPGWSPKSNGLMPDEPSGLPPAQPGLADPEPVMRILVPYGATYLRLTTLPVIPSPSP